MSFFLQAARMFHFQAFDGDPLLQILYTSLSQGKRGWAFHSRLHFTKNPPRPSSRFCLLVHICISLLAADACCAKWATQLLHAKGPSIQFNSQHHQFKDSWKSAHLPKTLERSTGKGKISQQLKLQFHLFTCLTNFPTSEIHQRPAIRSILR